MKLRRIVYSSKASIKFNKRDLLDLLHDSRAYNTIDNISGVLIHKDGYFLQILEGEPKDLNNLLSRLQKDSRHSEFKIIDDRFVSKRMFLNWAMGCADFDDPSLSMIPGVLSGLNDPKVIEELINRLPEVATYLHNNLTYQQINGYKEDQNN
ncbi:BLUF domain-containing protein [Polaribacter sp. Z014]|uniref:BLUF domain-containing protein n=1 Tax=Polaribacter sp. Z014 TaxID=2927126 RepID=UPI00202286F1|nr:BLUF domain-containing protein [Polaribacter sp. Z014]MCL7762852.1 BLUF domain-containing protein [Polaribacter sp. Z014]